MCHNFTMTIAMFQGHIFAMVQSLKAQASSKRGGRGGVAPHQLSHGVNSWASLPNDEVPHSAACCVAMPLQCKFSAIIATAWLGTNVGHLGWHVEGALTMWQPGTCWWSPWTSGRLLLKVANLWFVFRHLPLLTCWMCPLMELVWCRPQNVAQVVTMACTRSLDFSAVVSRGGAMPPGLEFPIFTWWRVLAFHKTFGGALMAPGPYRTKKIRQRRSRVKTAEKRWTHDR